MATDQRDLAVRGGGEGDGARLVPVAMVLVVLGFAWWLRAAPLAPGSLWLDDLWVVAPSQAGDLGDAAEMLVTTPLFTVAVNAVLALTGPSAVAAQLLPFAAGVLGPVIALGAARSMGWRWPAALVTAVVVAVAPEHVVHSTRVKQYTLEAAIGLVVVALGWRVLRGRTSPWIFAAVACGATLVSASAGVFAGSVLAAVAVVSVAAADDRRAAVGAVGPPVLGFAGFAVLWWAVYLRTRVPAGLRDYWRDDFLRTDAGAGSYLADLGSSLDRLAAGFLPVASAWPWLALAGAVVLVARPRLGLVLGAPVAAAVVLATLELAPIGTGRTDVYLLPSAAFALGAAIDVVARRAGRATPMAAAGAAAITVVLVGAVFVRDLRPTTYPQEDVRPLIELAEAHRPPDGRIVVYPATRWAYAVYTDGGFEPVGASNETGFEVRITTPGVTVLGPHRDDPARYGLELARAVGDARSVTFVASHWREDILEIERWFPANGWQEVRRVERPGARLVEWRRSPT